MREENSRTIYNSNESYIMDMIDSFENEIISRYRQQGKDIDIEIIQFFEELDFNDIGNLKNIFVMQEKNEDGKIIQHIYAGNTENEIATIDENGNATFVNENLRQFLGNIQAVEIEGLQKKNTQMGKVEKIRDEEQEAKLIGQSFDEKEIDEDLEITSFREITDPYIKEDMPELFEQNNDKIAIGWSNKLHRYVILEEINGKMQLNQKIKPAKMEMRTIISISEDGNKLEKKVPYLLMKTDNLKQEIAVNLVPNGEVDIERVEVTDCNQRVA